MNIGILVAKADRSVFDFIAGCRPISIPSRCKFESVSREKIHFKRYRRECIENLEIRIQLAVDN